MKYSIYKITNNTNNNFYIGVTTKEITERFIEHSKTNSHIGRAIRKYGLNNFTIKRMKYCKNEQQMYCIEKRWVNEKFVLRSDTYNHMEGGHGGNSLKFYSHEKMENHKKIKSSAITEMWSKLSEIERFQRNSKSQKNTNQKLKGAKISEARLKLFKNETTEQKQIRIQKAKDSAKKVKRLTCHFCSKLITPGNFQRHSNACYDNPTSHRYGKFPKKIIFPKYELTSPNGEVFIKSGNIRKICAELNISSYLLLNNLNSCVPQLNKNTAKKAVTLNTINWKLRVIT